MSIQKRILLVLLLIFSMTSGTSQAEIDTLNDWIPKLSRYRDYLLRKNPNATIELKKLLDKWNTYETTEAERTRLTFNVLKLREIDKNSFKRIKKKALKYMPESNISKSLSDEDILTMSRNSELLDLIHLGFLENEYPFKINVKGNLFKEIQGYNFKATDKIGEIGCGVGAFGVLLNKIHSSIEIYLNELDPSFLKYINKKLENSTEVYETENFKLIKGKKTSTNLEDYELDKIILRNTFHHFTKKSEMLDSIKKSLSLEGELYVVESTIELDKTDDICKDAMSKSDIINLIELNGFKLIDQIEFDERIFLKFSVEKK